MSRLINGVHHIAIKPTDAQREEAIRFYTELLGLEVVKTFGPPEKPILMVSCGDGTCIEILSREEQAPSDGAFPHVALACDRDKVDEIVELVRAAGYPIKAEPHDMELAGAPCRNAFFYGPVGEEIELFWEGPRACP